MAKVELKRLIGNRRDPATGKVLRIGWDMDRVFLNGRQIATINRVPGAAVGLMPGAILTESEKEAVMQAVAEARAGVRPAKIGEPLPYEILDEIEGGDSSENEGDDE